MFKNSEFNIYPELIVDEPVETRLAHAKNVDSSPELLKFLMKDRFWFVRNFVASNPSSPDECLKFLCNDADFRVRDAAKRNLSMRGVFDKPALYDVLRAAKNISRGNVKNNKLISRETSKEIEI